VGKRGDAAEIEAVSAGDRGEGVAAVPDVAEVAFRVSVMTALPASVCPFLSDFAAAAEQIAPQTATAISA
jgi:hypothetical protein